MASVAPLSISIAAAVNSVTERLVSVQSWGDAHFITLPLAYPGGTLVAVKIDPIIGGVRVSDNGFAYRELESVGAEASFARTARKIAEADELETNRRAIYLDVPLIEMERAVLDVAKASWKVVERIYSRLSDHEEDDIAGHLRLKLEAAFGAPNVRFDESVSGASTFSWEVSAVVRQDRQTSIFQAVSNHANSIYRASTAFHDLGALDSPPGLVAVVRDKAALGSRLRMLSQAGHVIEDQQPNDVFRRAAT